MSEACGDRASEELMHAGSQAAALAADDDHFGIEDIGEPAQGVGDFSGELTELHGYALMVSH